MNGDRERKLTLSDPGRDAAADEIELMLNEAAPAEEDDATEDSGFDSFLERLPVGVGRRTGA